MPVFRAALEAAVARHTSSPSAVEQLAAKEDLAVVL